MDSLRGPFFDRSETEDHDPYAVAEEIVAQAPPPAIGQDERRMQVRAYNFWATMVGDRTYPSIEDLDLDALPDFAPYSVLLDFTAGIENPAVPYLGAELARECGTKGQIAQLEDVPARSLLSRITDHYMQIIANQAPIGFEAEFVNQRGTTILYRGILLPFSRDDDTIDFILGVINWKELADQQETDALMLEMDQVLAAPTPAEIESLPAPSFGETPIWPAPVEEPLELALPELDPAEMGLADWLASARELADAVHGNEERTRNALYAAIGRAYDFSLAAAEAPEDFAELLSDAGLSRQDRAPMTPIVKLVFGADYDKTRLTEYAAALAHAHRLALAQGALADFLATAPGGLKGVVQAERRMRREESGKAVVPREGPRETVARKLRRIQPRALSEIASDGSEFALLVARRMDNGEVVLVGEVPEDVTLLERAARKLLD